MEKTTEELESSPSDEELTQQMVSQIYQVLEIYVAHPDGVMNSKPNEAHEQWREQGLQLVNCGLQEFVRLMGEVDDNGLKLSIARVVHGILMGGITLGQFSKPLPHAKRTVKRDHARDMSENRQRQRAPVIEKRRDLIRSKVSRKMLIDSDAAAKSIIEKLSNDFMKEGIEVPHHSTIRRDIRSILEE
jgi:hypothetical protein